MLLFDYQYHDFMTTKVDVSARIVQLGRVPC